MKRIGIYLAFVFGLSWAIMGAAIAATGGIELVRSGVDAFTSKSLLPTAAGIVMFMPLVSVLLTKLILRGKEEVPLAWHPNFKGNVRWYLAAWLAPALVSLLGVVLFFLVFPGTFDPSMQAYIGEQLANLQAAGMPQEQIDFAVQQLQQGVSPAAIVGVAAAAVLVAPFINAIPAFGEEAGWRGFLWPELLKHMSPRVAVLAMGVIWGIWHAPMTCMGHNYSVGYPGFPITGILVMIVACTAISSCLGFITLKTGSVLPAALAHGAINAVANLGIIFYAGSVLLLGPSPMGLVAGIPLFLLGFICWLRMPPAG